MKTDKIEEQLSKRNSLILKLQKIASFYEEPEKAYDLILEHSNKTVGFSVDCFLESQKEMFLKRKKHNFPHKLFILENILDKEPIKSLTHNRTDNQRNAYKISNDYHGQYNP
ncbi:hypothetical protein FJZ55_09280 [Candidatus Woesearchaeota archaeon]|nr:hypothetical protein [Candidatus Woesearchaeota archaeon]